MCLRVPSGGHRKSRRFPKGNQLGGIGKARIYHEEIVGGGIRKAWVYHKAGHRKRRGLSKGSHWDEVMCYVLSRERPQGIGYTRRQRGGK